MFWHIIVPQLRPATFIAVVITVVGALRSFDLVQVMTTVGPMAARRFWLSSCSSNRSPFRMGYGAAIAVVLFLIINLHRLLSLAHD
jgi:multiple sugar transport system permease protein